MSLVKYDQPAERKNNSETSTSKVVGNDNGTRLYLVLNLFHPKQQLIWSRNVVNVTLIKISIRSNSFRISINWQVWSTFSQWVNCDKCSQYLDLGQIRIVKPWRENHHKAGCESLHDILLVQLGSNILWKWQEKVKNLPIEKLKMTRESEKTYHLRKWKTYHLRK